MARSTALRSLRCARSHGLRDELSASTGIRVTDIESGVVATELTECISDAEAGERFQLYWTDRTPLEAEDAAQVVL